MTSIYIKEGTTLPQRRDFDRFWEKVDIRDQDACWEWTAAKDRLGYGHFRLEGKIQKAHRVVFHLVGASIASDLEVDHICRNRGCCNPFHLRAATHKENMENGAHALKTHCNRGHELSGKNVCFRRASSGLGWRRCCVLCERLRARKK